MTERELFQTMEKAIDAFASKPSSEAFLDMQRSGLINADGKLQEWDAFLAIIATDAIDSKRATKFLCLKPALGLPGDAKIVVRRESVIAYLNQGRRIITAIRDGETGALREGENVHLTSRGAIRTDANDIDCDNLGNLPIDRSMQNFG